MTDVFAYPLGAVIAAGLGVTISLITIWATLKRERREQKRELKAANDELRAQLREYIDIKLHSNDELRQFFTKWIQRVEDRIDRREKDMNKDHH